MINFVDAWRGSHAEHSQLGQLQRQRTRLEAKAQSLKDPNTASDEARKLGMVLPGERSFSIKGPSR